MDPNFPKKFSKSDSKIDVKVEQQSNHQRAQEQMRTNGKNIRVPYEDTRHKVSNNMTKTCVTSSRTISCAMEEEKP